MVDRGKEIVISLPDSMLSEVDGIATAESSNRNELIQQAVGFFLTERRRRMLREEMKKGYLEMAKINLALALEQQKLESEVFLVCGLSRAEG